MTSFVDWLKGVEAAPAGAKAPPLPPLAPETKVEIPVEKSTTVEPMRMASLMSSPELPKQPGEVPKPRPMVTNSEVRGGCQEVRAVLDQTGYSSWVSDAQVEHIVTVVLVRAAKIRAGVK